MNKIVTKAIELYEADMGGCGCIDDASCECFACRLRDFSIDIDREDAGLAGEFTDRVLSIRDRISVIITGEIERQHCVGGREAYGHRRGMRKLMLKDAKSIAAGCVASIDRAVQIFTEGQR